MKETPSDQDFPPLDRNERSSGTDPYLVFSLWDEHVETVVLEAEKNEALRLLRDLNDATAEVAGALAHLLGTS